MPVKTAAMTIAAAIAFAAALGGAAPQGANAAKVVNCYDPARNLIQRKDDYDCKHRAISDAEADAIRHRRNEYVRKSIEIEPNPAASGTGSGFFVSSAGDVVTNNHVIATCGNVSILTPDGKTYDARVLSSSGQYDLALLATNARPKSIATITPTSPAVGANVEVVGFPASLRPRRLPLRASGQFNGVRDNGSGVDILLIGARVAGGSSGSPVLDDDGRVIGVVFAKMDPRKILPHNGKALLNPATDITLATKATDLVTFLTANGVSIPHETNNPDPAEAYAVRVNCLK